MGKAPEKVTGNGHVVKRYQRKAPAPEAAVKQEDNQMEHRAAEPVVTKQIGEKEPANDENKASKPRNPASARKKKPKAAIESVSMAPVEEAADVAVVAPKKKMKKRQLSEKGDTELGQTPAATAAAAVVEPQLELQQSNETAEVVAKQKLSKSQQRKRKQQTNTTSEAPASTAKKEPPSLLKQLLWKAKPVAAALSPSSASSASSASSSAAVDAAVVPAVTSRKDKPSPAVKSPKPRKQQQSTEDADEDEEVAYTVSERQSRKLQASKRVQKTKNKAKASTATAAVCVVASEPSSQETQSGSDEDDAASSSVLTAYENLVPSEAIQPKELSVALVLETALFPEPFPVALAADVELLQQHGVTVHEVMIEDFAFHPPQLRIKNGDVVVWKVSTQTLAMVEHSLEVSMVHRTAPKVKKFAVVKASTPPLGSGASFAWRFAKSSRVNVECSVYQTKGVVLVGNVQAQKEKKSQVVQKPEPVVAEAETEVVKEAPALSKTQIKRQKQAAKRLRAAEAARLAAESEQIEAGNVDLETGRDSIDAEPVFHPPQDLSRSAEMDAGVCRAVLTQLEEVAAATQSTKTVIMIGDVECPLVSDNQVEELEDPAADVALTSITLRRPEDKPSLADEWSGTEEEDDDEEDTPERDDEKQTGEIEDFQQRIIGMLQRSEQARADQRRSFQHEQSGFDAGATYDFFKRRFMQVQKEERRVVYSTCPVKPVAARLKVTDVVSVLAGASA